MQQHVVPPGAKPLVKIVATLGPASTRPGVLDRLFEAGVNVVRYNCSHGQAADLVALDRAVRAAAERQGKEVATLVDLQGPKIRCNPFEGGSINLTRGGTVIMRFSTSMGEPGIITTKFRPLVEKCKVGDPILLDDGLLRLEVIAKNEDHLVCKIIQGGVLKNHKGINLPETDLGVLPALTPKDKEDATFALGNLNPDFIALSFVRQAQDIIDLRDIIKASGKITKIVAKLEKPEAINNLAAILDVVDAVMVARGDLGVEVGNEKVPELQKHIIRCCVERGIPVITATQMLESMTHNPTCTRAEASDVANAVWDGTDAVMLSGETAIGEFPVETVQMMRQVILQAEHFLRSDPQMRRRFNDRDFDPNLQKDSSGTTLGFSIGRAARKLAEEVGAVAFGCSSDTGNAAIRLATSRPMLPIYVFTQSLQTVRRMCLVRGCMAYRWSEEPTDPLASMDSVLLSNNCVTKGQAVVYTLGFPSLHNTTNTTMVRFV